MFEPLESIEHAVHSLREIRKAVGPGVELSVDYHHRLSVAEAAYFCQLAESPTYVGQDALDLVSTVRLEKLLPASLGLSLPVSIAYSSW